MRVSIIDLGFAIWDDHIFTLVGQSKHFLFQGNRKSSRTFLFHGSAVRKPSESAVYMQLSTCWLFSSSCFFRRMADAMDNGKKGNKMTLAFSSPSGPFLWVTSWTTPCIRRGLFLIRFWDAQGKTKPFLPFLLQLSDDSNKILSMICYWRSSIRIWIIRPSQNHRYSARENATSYRTLPRITFLRHTDLSLPDSKVSPGTFIGSR